MKKEKNRYQPLGLYIHIPFCAHKCPYCDFNTYAGLEASYDATVDALCYEMATWREALADREISTVFIGGGTPTVLAEDQLSRLLTSMRNSFQLAPTAEITCEANPGTVDQSKFSVLRGLGVNRLSIGVQSFQAAELEFLGRIHDVADVFRAFEAAREAGFDNINLDFIFGIPDQSEEAWLDTLEQALALAPEHFSLYSLIVEPNTPLHHWVQSGRVAGPDEDQAAVRFEMAMASLARAGYHHYEVSNWAIDRRHPPVTQAMPTNDRAVDVPSHACRHNLIYWRNHEYLGIGPGAHSHLHRHSQGEQRWENRKAVQAYVKRVQQDEKLTSFQEQINHRLSMGETMMLGLRLLQEGVDFSAFKERYGIELKSAFEDELAKLSAWDLLEIGRERVRLTPAGLMLGNQVFLEFLP